MSPAEAKALADMFIGGIEREAQTTRRVIAAIPENQLDFKLGEKGRTARELAWHLIAADTWFVEGVAKGDFSHPEKEAPPNASVNDMLAYYDEFPAKVEKLKSLSGDDLAKVIS